MFSFEKAWGIPREERKDVVDFSRSWFTWERGNLTETNI